LRTIQEKSIRLGAVKVTETTGWALDQILNAALGYQMSTARWEGFCAGNAHWPVRGVVVCYAPTLQILRRAAAEGKTLIITREHPFYLHGGLNYPYDTEGLEAALKDDPVVTAKNDIITANKIMIYRISTAWDNFRPQAQSAALAQAMGFTQIIPQPNPKSRGVICDTPRTAIKGLAQTAYETLKARSPRIIGDPEATVTRVAVLSGETDPKLGLAALIADSKVDGVITGAGGVIDEVDGAIGYFRDVVGSGRKIALLAVGYGPSEEPGGAEMVRWMRTVLPDVRIDWWQVPDPSWVPR
jgi:putative NIF3 family GTP cyclohydrolase 1 type 2